MNARPGTSLPIVYAIVFLAFFDTFALLPTVGPYAQSLGADPVAVGVAVAAYSVTSLVFNLVGGLLLDRVGRKPLAVIGLVGAAVTVLLYPFATTAGYLIAVRLAHGPAGGVLVPALFTVAGDLADPGARGRTMGRAGAFIGVAAVIGPAVAGPLRGAGGFDAVFVLVAAVLALGALLAVLFVRETAAPPETTAVEPPTTASVISRSDLLLAIAAVFGFTASFGTLAAFLPGAVETLGAGPAVSGGLFALISGIAAVLMLSPTARWVDRSGVTPPVRTGMLLFVAAQGLLAVFPTIPVAVGASMLFGVGFGLLFPAVTGAVAIAVPLRGRGRAYGLFNAGYSLGFIVGAPAAGALLRLTGNQPLPPTRRRLRPRPHRRPATMSYARRGSRTPTAHRDVRSTPRQAPRYLVNWAVVPMQSDLT